MAAIGKIGTIEVGDISKMLVNSASPMRSPETARDIDLSPTKISSAGKIQHALSQLNETARRLTAPQTWQAAKAVSSAPEVLDATTQEADTEQKIDVQVDQVAQAQTTAAPLYSPLATPIGLGTLNIELGNWNTSFSSFTANPNWPKARVSTAPGDVSVERLRDKINAAGIGVIANVISDPTGSYLILRAASPGKDNGFRITAEVSPEATEQAVQSLKSLEFDPANNSSGMKLTQQAQDALLKVNGDPLTSGSNFIEDVVPGVDVTAKQTSAKPVSVAVRMDRDVTKTAVQAFVQSYNAVQDQSNEKDSNPAAKSVTKAMTSIWSSSDANATQLRKGLQTLGIALGPNQQLTLDSSQLDSTLANHSPMPAGLEQLTSLVANAAPTGTNNAPPKNSAAAQQTAANTSPLFRQAVLEQYVNNMYAEDAH